MIYSRGSVVFTAHEVVQVKGPVYEIQWPLMVTRCTASNSHLDQLNVLDYWRAAVAPYDCLLITKPTLQVYFSSGNLFAPLKNI